MTHRRPIAARRLAPRYTPESQRSRLLVLPILLVLLLLLGACNRDEEQPEQASGVPTFTPTAIAGAAVPDADATAAIVESAASGDTAGVPIGAPGTSPDASQTSAPVALPTATSAPSPTITPTPLSLAEELDAARAIYRIGDYAAATSALMAVLNRAQNDPVIRLEARFELARTYLAAGAYNDALAMLDLVDTEAAAAGAGAGDYVALGTHLRGRALAALNRQPEAIAAFTTFLQSYPWMAESVQARIAESYTAAGDTSGAVGAWRSAAESAGNTSSQVLLLEYAAQTHTAAGQHAQAAAVYDEILTIAQNAGYRAQILYNAGASLAAAGDEAGAIDRWQRSTAESPGVRSAYLSLVELVNRNIPFDAYQRAYIDLMAGAWLPAVGAYEAFLATIDATDARFDNALHELGQAYLGAGDTASAQTYFDRVIAEFPACDCFGQAWIDKARAQVVAGDTVGARRTWRTFARDHATNPLAAEALWLSGNRAMRDENPMEAAIDFLALAEAFPASERAADALYAVGLGAIQQGLYGQAVEVFTRLQRDYPENRWDAVTYWLGRAYQGDAQDAPANAQWQSLVDRAPDIYYGILANRALNRLSIQGGAQLNEMRLIAGAPSRLPGDDGSQAFADAWLKQWDVFAGVTTPSALPDVVANDVDLSKARLLLELDQRADAVDALERTYVRYRDDPVALYPLSLEFARMGAYRHSITSMVRLIQFSPATLIEDAPSYLQRFAWPRPFKDLITQEALSHDMDPFLYFSMIRQESLFEEGARSWAAAQGLAQIIPDTARWVAEQQGHPEWSNELIYLPYINVDFGAYYFDWVRGYLDGNPVSALVGYNAGPGNSEFWREVAGPDDALFTEILTVAEPRHYVQLITQNLYHYTRLYTGVQ